MRDLAQIQRWMQTVIMHEGGAAEGVASQLARGIVDVEPDAVEDVVTRSQSQSALERLDVYNRAYFARLIDCLREEFPVVRHAVGEEAFDRFALSYLRKYPSQSYTLNRLAGRFPQFLAESRPSEEEGAVEGISLPDFIFDVATLEQTYGEVFDGPGVEGQKLLDVEQLANVPAERWPEARLVPVPCLRLLELRYPVHTYFSAVRRKKEPPYPQPRKTNLAVTRRNFVVRRYALSGVQFILLKALLEGQPIGSAIEVAAQRVRSDAEGFAEKLRLWFRNWTAEGFFRTVELP